MLRIVKNQKGSTLVLAALMMVSMVGFAALSIDTGLILTADHQLQSAVDAAALAGASGLLINQSTATSRALTVGALNSCINQPVALNPGNVSYPTGNRIRVQINRPINLFMARALGVNTANVNATAIAELSTLSQTKKLRPFCVPFEHWCVGSQVVLKVGSICPAPATSTYYFPVDYPPANTGTPVSGAAAYSDNIKFSYLGDVKIGDVLQVQTGNVNSSTQQGINFLISQDPNASWNVSQQAVVNSVYPGFSSPRILKVPFFDTNDPPHFGQESVTIAGLGAFFVESVTSAGNIRGRFIEITTEGSNNTGPGAGMLYKVKLLQ